MDINPWQVASIQEFSFLKCPECTFDSKEEDTFQDHAIENQFMIKLKRLYVPYVAKHLPRLAI